MIVPVAYLKDFYAYVAKKLRDQFRARNPNWHHVEDKGAVFSKSRL